MTIYDFLPKHILVELDDSLCILQFTRGDYFGYRCTENVTHVSRYSVNRLEDLIKMCSGKVYECTEEDYTATVSIKDVDLYRYTQNVLERIDKNAI